MDSAEIQKMVLYVVIAALFVSLGIYGIYFLWKRKGSKREVKRTRLAMPPVNVHGELPNGQAMPKTVTLHPEPERRGTGKYGVFFTNKGLKRYELDEMGVPMKR